MLKGKQSVESSVVADMAGGAAASSPQGGSHAGYATVRSAFAHDFREDAGEHTRHNILDSA